MALLTIRNKLDQEVASDKKVGAAIEAVTFPPLSSLVIGDNQVGPTMQQQINNGVLQITSTVPSADAGQGTIADMDLASANARLGISLDAGEFAVLDKLVVKITDVDTVTSDAVISVGTSGPGYDDLIAEKGLVQCRAVDDAWVEAIEGKGKVVNGPAEIWVNVKTPATAVSLVADVYLFGTGNFT